ncbi:TetR/AcrR family transcriptional regulator [Nonomuraea cavernae]|uniref:TetR/AcrR family transcriptional regulator n=1 Tax=Nonomuraea cavernae TaxID=2045107 RepID=UPI001CD97BB0|nr:TetR family transcriptional regulator [Nonomuraea cavernae]MCA2184300.1 TetR family transcriptional regulator [Nonomuraea cavernae]
MSIVTPPARLPLRERKKLRTREALIDTALEHFTDRGFDGTTLDDLCAAVEVSKRTFFRYFDSKEDVAMAPTQDLWAAFLDDLQTRRPTGGPLLTLLQDTLLAALDRMPAEGWAERVLLTRRLAARTPSMNAHGLQFCDRTTRGAITILRERFGLTDPHDLRPRLALDMMVAAFHCALEEWAFQPGPVSRDDLTARLRDAFAAIPGSVTMTVA